MYAKQFLRKVVDFVKQPFSPKSIIFLVLFNFLFTRLYHFWYQSHPHSNGGMAEGLDLKKLRELKQKLILKENSDKHAEARYELEKLE